MRSVNGEESVSANTRLAKKRKAADLEKVSRGLNSMGQDFTKVVKQRNCLDGSDTESNTSLESEIRGNELSDELPSSDDESFVSGALSESEDEFVDYNKLPNEYSLSKVTLPPKNSETKNRKPLRFELNFFQPGMGVEDRGENVSSPFDGAVEEESLSGISTPPPIVECEQPSPLSAVVSPSKTTPLIR